MPLTGEAKREWQREYDRVRRSTGRAIKRRVEQLVADGAPGRTVARAILEGAQAKLQTVLTEQGLLPTLVIAKVREKLDATRPYMLAVEGEKGKREAIEGDDNDAQLRACELAIRLQERAGTIPSAAGPSGGGTTINVFEVIYAPQQVSECLIPAIDASPASDEEDSTS